MNLPSSRKSHELVLLLALLAIAAAVRVPGIFSRSIWYDEAISLLMSAGNGTPSIREDGGAPGWPRRPAPAARAQELFTGCPSLPEVIAEVRRDDVHPPGYYWTLGLWRCGFGSSLESSRLFSLLCSLAAVLALYLLLRSARIDGALSMTLVYALSTGAVHSGHEARAYALASWMLLAAAGLALRARELAPRDTKRAAAAALGAAALCGLAFHVNYLAVFPAAAILGWLAVFTWRASPVLALAAPAVAAAIGALGVPTPAAQLGKRPDQLSGHLGPGAEVMRILGLNAEMMGIPLPDDGDRLFTLAALGLFSALVGFSVLQIARRWPDVNRGFWALILPLAAAPSAGVLLLDFAFDKQLHVSRYLNFAGPALAVLATYGLVGLLGSKKRSLGAVLLGGLLAIQASNVNWGLEVCPNREFGGTARSLAREIRLTSSPNHLVIIGDGYGPGNQGPIVYELDGEEQIVTFGNFSDLDQLMNDVASYDDLWLVFSLDAGSLEAENELLERLRATGLYRGIRRSGLAFHMAKVEGRRPEVPGTPEPSSPDPR